LWAARKAQIATRRTTRNGKLTWTTIDGTRKQAVVAWPASGVRKIPVAGYVLPARMPWGWQWERRLGNGGTLPPECPPTYFIISLSVRAGPQIRPQIERAKSGL
jgi:hypothetical protein